MLRIKDALVNAATENNAVGKVYNLGAPDPLSLEDTAKIMCQRIQGSDYLMTFPEERKAIDVGDFIATTLPSESIWVGTQSKFPRGYSTLLSISKEMKHYL